MASATFRFYDDLNDFLPRARRGHAFSAPCARGATTKHMIEALGVPHTEVELILVNGESTGLHTLLEDGDRVAVYPRFGAIDVASLVCVRQRPPGRMRFVADAQLGGLARLLRMAGFDTIYRNTIDDDTIDDDAIGGDAIDAAAIDDAAIEALAMDERRVVLTRDRELLKRRGVEYGAYVRALRPPAQLREVIARFALAERARPFTLCLDCNAPLRSVDKRDVLARLPPAVRACQDAFTMCDVCDRVYWKGSHWQRMAGMLDAALADEPD